jgi:hypothetical protein
LVRQRTVQQSIFCAYVVSGIVFTVATAGQGAEQMTGRLAGVFGEQFKILSGREPFAAFLFADGGDGEAQFGGDLFQSNTLAASPVSESVGKGLAHVAFESRFLRHGGNSSQAAAGGKKQIDPVWTECLPFPFAQTFSIPDPSLCRGISGCRLFRP